MVTGTRLCCLCCCLCSTHGLSLATRQRGPTAQARRRTVLRSVAAAGGLLAGGPARCLHADIPNPYCIPGVTAERCRGVFWETGKLFKKDDNSGGDIGSVEDYRREVTTLTELRRGLSTELRQRGGAEVGATASAARAQLRQTGVRLCRSLGGDERYESEYQLKKAMKALDDVDAAALRVTRQDAERVAPGFDTVSLLYDEALQAFDKFVRGLPAEPDPIIIAG